MRTYSMNLKITASITLMLYLWCFGPLFQIPASYAAAGSRGTKGQKAATSGQERRKSTEEKFRESLNRIGEAGEDREKLKAEKSELETLDTELQRQFKETETKIKNLPEVIKQRQRAFVKRYGEGLSALRTHLDGVEKAKTGDEARIAAGKVRVFLEKTKGPSRHQKLDPNNLPFKARKVTKTREPRLKREDFERDFPQQKTQNKRKVAEIRLMPDLLSSRRQYKPVLLAFNETASDVPFQIPRPSGERAGVRGGLNPKSEILNLQSQLAFSDSSSFLLAQAGDAPTAEDLAENGIEIQFTDDIKAKAQELSYSPLRIYEWVRNNIEYAPTYGSIQGADQCLQSRICNDTDTASLLIALLRVSGVYSHYEYSTIEIPIEKAMNLVGGVTDPKMAGTILATNGIPVTLMKTSGGTYKAVQLEHVYVRAWIDYIPSRGAVHKQGDTWVPLDPSYKQYTYTQGIDIKTAVPFDAQALADQIKATATINETEGYVTNVNSALVQQTMQDYQTQVQNYINQNYPNATVGDVLGKKEIIKQEFGILPETLPYKTILVGLQFAQIPDSLRATISFSIPDPTGMSAGLSYSTSLPQIAGKKITLSFSPATANDKTIIETYLQATPGSLPAYLINLKPELRIEGLVVATGSSVTMGSAQSFTMSLTEPGFGVSRIDNIIQAGEYFGIGLNTGKIAEKVLRNIKDKLAETKNLLVTKDYTTLTKDALVGDLLYFTAINYFADLDTVDEITAKVKNVIRYRTSSVGMFYLHMNVEEIFGIPKTVSSKGMMMDVDRIMQAVFSKDGDMNKLREYMLASGGVSSAFESRTPEQIFSTPSNSVEGLSAVKALQIASEQGIPIYSINQENASIINSQLQVAADVKKHIQDALNAGKIIAVPKRNININGWDGCGYIIIDPNTGAGAYMISGGTSGGFLLAPFVNIALHFLVTEAAAAELEETYISQAGGNCIKYFHSSEYWGCVGLVVSGSLEKLFKGFLGIAMVMQFFGGWFGYAAAILIGAGMVAWAVNQGAKCRELATHCDPPVQ